MSIFIQHRHRMSPDSWKDKKNEPGTGIKYYSSIEDAQDAAIARHNLYGAAGWEYRVVERKEVVVETIYKMELKPTWVKE